MAQYVYGIVEATSKPPRGRGIAGAPLRLVAGEEIAALVSEIGGDRVRLGREEVLLHSQVLERALGRGPVLPMRFGIVMDDTEEVHRRLLDEHGPELRAQLTEMEGKVEIRIRATYDESSVLQDVVREHPQIAAMRASVQGRSEDAGYYERIRLGELVAAAIERRRDRDAQAILEALAGQAVATETSDPSHERVVVQASFLVERARIPEFNAIVDRVADGYGGQIRFKYTGPLPPHSFVELAERV
ncbi:MAG: GvpL/GvpF family gas vesicle protein [Solirubrobacterales bacterium]|nr:GvpL/GvpF family gas vesicle protein [Solirubrobacterales bacterium]